MSDSHTEPSAQDHGHEHPKHELSDQAKRIYAIRDLLLEKGVLTEKDIRCQIEYQEARSPANGARLVARAWTDPAFKARLIADPKSACAEMGIDATSINEFVVLENTDKVRHMVVCTRPAMRKRPSPSNQPVSPMRCQTVPSSSRALVSFVARSSPS